MTAAGCGGYGSAPLGIRATRLRSAGLLAASTFLAVACSDSGPVTPPATDRFFYPTGLAIRHEPPGCTGGSPGCQTQLLVVSSNFDLRFDSATGGTVIAVDVDQALATPLAPLQAPALLGVARIGSFGGELAILDSITCSGFAGAEVLVASRSQNALYRVSIGAGGALSCGDGCQVPLEGTFGDPYGVTVACGPSFGQLAFVTYLRTPNSEGQLSQIDLASGNRTQKDLGSVSPAHSTVFDAFSSRLYVTEQFGKVAFSPLRWFSLVATEPVSSVDLYPLVRGAELRGMALSSDSVPAGTPGAHGPTRAYLALRIYDVDTATSTGLRPINDVGGALAVVDLTPDPSGQPAARLLNLVTIDRGASEIRVIPRPGLRDLVAVTCTDDDTLTLYDDDTGTVAKVFDICGGVEGEPEPPPCDAGKPLTGDQPFGLATEALASGRARLYVGSFDRSWVNVIEIDPLNPAAAPVWARIGPERP